MEPNSVKEFIERELKRIGSDFSAFATARKETEGEIIARLREVEQKLARPRGGADLGGSSGPDIGALVIAAPHLDAFRAGEIKELRVPVKSFPLKASTSILTTGNLPSVPDRDSEFYGDLPRRTSVQDFIPRRPTVASSVEYVKIPRDGAASVQLQNDSPVVTDGALKAQIGLNATIVNAPAVTIAVWTGLAKQTLDDNSGLSDFVNTTLLDSLEIAEEDQILTGSGLTGNLAGLLTEATAFSRHVALDKFSDTLRRAITQVQLARGVANGIVINPADAEALELTKDTQGRYLLTYTSIDAMGHTIVWRVPTAITDAISENNFLVGDFARACRIFDRQQAMVVLSTSHADYFVRNLVAVLAEQRLALTIPRPALLVKGTFV